MSNETKFPRVEKMFKTRTKKFNNKLNSNYTLTGVCHNEQQTVLDINSREKISVL